MQVVVAPMDQHRQIITSPQHDASLSGEIRAPASHIRPMPLDERRIIGHRAMLEIRRPHLLINLGIGMPEVPHLPPLIFAISLDLPLGTHLSSVLYLIGSLGFCSAGVQSGKVACLIACRVCAGVSSYGSHAWQTLHPRLLPHPPQH